MTQLPIHSRYVGEWYEFSTSISEHEYFHQPDLCVHDVLVPST